MTAKGPLQQAKQPAWPGVAKVRAGEGAIVHVSRRLVPKTNGDTFVELGLRLDEAPVPERRYPADFAWVDIAEGLVRIMFGQRRISGKSLRSLVIVAMTEETARNFLSTCKDFTPKLRTYLERTSIPESTLDVQPEEPDQTVVLMANIVAIAHSGNEACIDFYHASARSLHDAISRSVNQLGVEPLVRIFLTGSLLAGTLAAIERKLPESGFKEAK